VQVTLTAAGLKVRIGIGLGVGGALRRPDELGDCARGIEEAGFDSLWLSEVITSPAPDPLIALAYASAVTTRIKLGTSVMVLPGRSPVVAAKELATLDRLSSGRFLPIFGLGTPDPLEHQAFGVRRRDRSLWMDEAVPLIRRLWAEESVDHAGDMFHLEGARLGVRPARPLPIWFGGRGAAELERTGRLADGWLASFATPAEVATSIIQVQCAAARAQRAIDPDHFGILMLYSLKQPGEALREFARWRRPDLGLDELIPLGEQALTARIREFIQAGASKFILVPATPPHDWSQELAALAAASLHLQTAAHQTGRP
jgi:probable F420-dependent oxidoreductase